MNTTNLLQYTALTALLTAGFYGLAHIKTDLVQVGVVVACAVVVAILGLAAFDGARRIS